MIKAAGSSKTWVHNYHPTWRHTQQKITSNLKSYFWSLTIPSRKSEVGSLPNDIFKLLCWTEVYHTGTIKNLNYGDTKLTWYFLSFKRPWGTVKNTSSCSIHIPSELLNFLALLTMSSKFLILALISTFRNISATLPNCLTTSKRLTESHSHLSRHSPITEGQKKKILEAFYP